MLALLLITFLYFTPSILAMARKAPDTGSVIVINLFFGWTFVGWVISLAMAARSTTDTSINVSVHQGLQPGYVPATYGGHPSQALAPPYGQPSFHVPAPQQLQPQAPAYPPLPRRVQPDQVRPQVVAPYPANSYPANSYPAVGASADEAPGAHRSN